MAQPIEYKRLIEDGRNWKRWGPYLSERQWGTVREDYSPYGAAWDYFTHDQARSRAYRWGEEGIAGISDDEQYLCFAIALWNGVDPILKERLFGLTGDQGNHGEDVKEYYFYIDSTPTHSYMKVLYKYPQAQYPYKRLVEENRNRSRRAPEFEFIDTGVFDEDRYFDVFVEYAKGSPEDILIQITVCNRGPELKTLHLLPTLWFRNTWSWTYNQPKPILRAVDNEKIEATHPILGNRYLYCDGAKELLFAENETNNKHLFGTQNSSPYVKDGMNEYVVNGQKGNVNPGRVGTKASPYYVLEIGARDTKIVQLRLSAVSDPTQPLGKEFNTILQTRLKEADEFYQRITSSSLPEDLRNVQRQAFAGMLWTKQYYYYDVERWLEGDPTMPPPPPERKLLRNYQWTHMDCQEVISMPDKWEYPWFAAWDLAFHTIPLALIDPDFAKQQLDLMTREWYMHPNGQFAAYEWSFGDVNPPVHAWATWHIYKIEQAVHGRRDRQFLERVFQKLLLNFNWWVNRKDMGDDNVFEGGFLGLDNVGVFDRSAPLPTGGYMEQSDGTSWMAMYCLNLFTIAVELAQENLVYEDIATKFFEHFIYIASAMDRIGKNNDELWDEEDGFFYDLLRLPQGAIRIKVRSTVGLTPLFANATFNPNLLDNLPNLRERLQWFAQHRPELLKNISCFQTPGVESRELAAIVRPDKLRRILQRMLDPKEFLSPHGIRSLSRFHAEHPYIFYVGRHEYLVDYEPAESTTDLFGGNSNWRGPVWMPMNYLLIESLHTFHNYLGDDFMVECPTGSGNMMTLREVAKDLSNRICKIFLQDGAGRRPVYGGTEKFQTDPHWRDLILFYEYFHGDNGAGMGASHQTGWTGLVAKLIQQHD
jgi:hypothetical protein